MTTRRRRWRRRQPTCPGTTWCGGRWSVRLEDEEVEAYPPSADVTKALESLYESFLERLPEGRRDRFEDRRFDGARATSNRISWVSGRPDGAGHIVDTASPKASVPCRTYPNSLDVEGPVPPKEMDSGGPDREAQKLLQILWLRSPPFSASSGTLFGTVLRSEPSKGRRKRILRLGATAH